MPDATEDVNKIRQELERVRNLIQVETGIISRWNGNAVIIPSDAPYCGLKPFVCDIYLRADLVNNPVRWRTLIHEMLHSVSADYNQVDYNAFKGWEEGVVEQLQRLLRERILKALNIYVPEETFTAAESIALFNEYIAALEKVRMALEVAEIKAFYLDLLRTPLRHRYAFLLQRAMILSSSQKRLALEALSKAKVALEKRI